MAGRRGGLRGPYMGMACYAVLLRSLTGAQRSAKGVLVRWRDTRGDGVSADGKSSKDSVEVLAYGVSPWEGNIVKHAPALPCQSSPRTLITLMALVSIVCRDVKKSF